MEIIRKTFKHLDMSSFFNLMSIDIVKLSAGH